MPSLPETLELARHLDKRIGEVVVAYQGWTYALIFVVTWAKNGLIYVPILPTTTLMFAAGALCSPNIGGLSIWLLIPIATLAAWLGDFTNYGWGRWLGGNLATSKVGRFLKISWMDKGKSYYEKHGLNTFLLARWVSVLRSTIPFIAGSSKLSPAKFMVLSFVSCFVWVTVIAWIGYAFGEIPDMRSKLGVLSAGILLILSCPLYFSIRRDKKQRQSDLPLPSENP